MSTKTRLSFKPIAPGVPIFVAENEHPVHVEHASSSEHVMHHHEPVLQSHNHSNQVHIIDNFVPYMAPNKE